MSARLIYVAAPIDQGPRKGPGLIAAKSVVEQTLDREGVITFWPDRAFKVGAGTGVDLALERVNRAVLDRSDSMIALFPPGTTTIGVGREVEAAIREGIPVAVVTGGPDNRSWSAHDCQVFPWSVEGTFEAACWAAGVEGPGPVPEATREASEARGEPIEVVRNIPFAREPGSELLDVLPVRTYDGDAGFDLFVAEDTTIVPDEFVDVPCGVRVALPPGIWARITGRSSTMRRRGLLVADGVIDNGYRGPLFAGVRNLNGSEVTVRAGERIAQLIPYDLVAPRFVPKMVDRTAFDVLPHDGRGEAGFGSSGT